MWILWTIHKLDQLPALLRPNSMQLIQAHWLIGLNSSVIGQRSASKMALDSANISTIERDSKNAFTTSTQGGVLLSPASQEDSPGLLSVSDPSTLQTTAAVGFKACEILHSSFKNGISISYSTLSHLSKNSDGFQSSAFKDLIPGEKLQLERPTVLREKLLLKNKINHLLYIYITSLLSHPPLHLSQLSRLSQSARLDSMYYLFRNFPLTAYFTNDSGYMSKLISQFVPLCPSPAVSLGPFSTRLISSIFLDSIHML